MGAQGDRHRRDRDARADGAARGIRREPAAGRGTDHRLPAHDDPDRGADRDPGAARRQRPLELVQHLFDPGSRRRGDRGARHPGVRLEGRDRGGIRVVHRADAVRPRRVEAEHGARRRRRRHQDHPRGPSRTARRHPRHLGGDDDRGAPALRDDAGRDAEGAGVQRQRQRHQVEIRQPLRRAREPGRRHQARHRRDAGRQGGGGVRLRRCRQGLGGEPAKPGRARYGHRDRPSTTCGG